MTPQEQESIITLALIASFADGSKDDHEHAALVAQTLSDKFSDNDIRQATNMVFVDLDSETYRGLATHLRNHDIQVDRPRWVMHLDVSRSDVDQIISAIRSF